MAVQCAVPRVTLLHADQCGAGTSRALSKFVEDLEGDYQAIWIDCSEIRSRPTFVDTLLEHFRRHDRWLPPVTLPPFLPDLNRISPALTRTTEGADSSKSDRSYTDVETKRAIDSITYAMRRGRYIIAIDSLGEFANEHPAEKIDELDKAARFGWIANVLVALAKEYRNFGPSIIAISYARNWTEEDAAFWTPAEDVLIKGFHGLQADGQDQYASTFVHSFKSSADRVVPAPPFDPATPWLTLIGSVAAAFRRPRSLVALTSIVADILLHDSFANTPDVSLQLDILITGLGLKHCVDACRDDCHRASQTRFAGNERRQVVEEMIARQLDGVVAGAFDTERPGQLLRHQEGGFYWMRGADRRSWYAALQRAIVKSRG